VKTLTSSVALAIALLRRAGGSPSLVHSLLDPLASIDINVAITNRVFAFVASESDLRGHVARYFNTVRTWLPVISQDRCYRRLSSFSDGQNSGFSVLTLSIIFISTVPQTTGPSLYLSIKYFIGMLEDMGANSLDLLQARLLVTVFEVGHGYLHAGNISIGAVTRTAMANGHGVKEYVDELECTEEMGNEEWAQVWCAILVIDR
jgi:hypothetical protein